jgi:hypothetical protein
MTKMDKLGMRLGAARDELATLQLTELHPLSLARMAANCPHYRITACEKVKRCRARGRLDHWQGAELSFAAGAYRAGLSARLFVRCHASAYGTG